MPHTPRTSYLVIRLLALVATLASAIATTPAPATHAASPIASSLPPDLSAAEIKQAGASLATDPADAAIQLVDIIFGNDEAKANAATAELLRRSGAIIVPPEGEVLAWPDATAFANAQIYAPEVASLAKATRAGEFVRAKDLQPLLEGVNILANDIYTRPSALQMNDYVAYLGQLGKWQGADNVVRTSGAAMRALSARRGDVLFANANLDEMKFDPLQITLMLAQHTRIFQPKGSAAIAPPALAIIDTLFGAQIAHAQAGPCTDIFKKYDAAKKEISRAVGGDVATGGGHGTPGTPAQGSSGGSSGSTGGGNNGSTNTAPDPGGHGAGDGPQSLPGQGGAATGGTGGGDPALNGATGIGDPAGDAVMGGLSDKIKGGFLDPKYAENPAFDPAVGALQAFLIMLGAELEIDKPDNTKYKEQEGSRAEHRTLKATAKFDPTMGRDLLKCYQLAGIALPNAGAMEGYVVRWRLDGGVQSPHLKPINADMKKMNTCAGGKCGETLGKDGVSTIQVYPPVETFDKNNPPKEKTSTVIVEASLDKPADFPFKLGDIFGMGTKGPFGWAKDKVVDLGKEIASRLALPTKTVPIQVKHHASDIFVARGIKQVGGVLAAYIASVPIQVDVVSCDGPAGPWKGKAGVPKGYSLGALVQAASQMTGIKADPNASNLNENFSFELSEGGGDQTFAVVSTGEAKLDAVVTMDWQAAREVSKVNDPTNDTAYKFGKPVGNIEVTLNGDQVPWYLAEGGVDFKIVRADNEPRCPNLNVKFEDL